MSLADRVLTEKELTSKSRNRLASKSFVFKRERRYPIEDKAHARNALARVSQFGSSAEKAKVRAAVHRKYPSIGESKDAPFAALLEAYRTRRKVKKA